jgi:uncharacterized protein (TIGR02145 family)
MKKTILLFAGLAFFAFNNQAQTVIDYDGNVYNTVTIDTQVWMKENLKVSHYNNGDVIPLVTDSLLWGSLGGGAYCYYKNDPITYSSTYGKLYNFYTGLDSRKLCPAGWHVPTNDEWLALATYLGGYYDYSTGGKMKETGTTHWAPPNDGATNSSGFTGLPGGFRRGDASFGWNGTNGLWWSSTPYSCGGWDWVLTNYDATISTFGMPSNSGYSIRCISNFGAQVNEINYQDIIKIYPNPVIDKVYLDCSEERNLKMQVYNVVGECVLQRELKKNKNEIDISNLSKGVYIIKVSGADWTVQRKLIKE